MRAFDSRLTTYASSTRRFLVLAVVLGVGTTVAIVVQAYALTNIIVGSFQDGLSLDSLGVSLGILVVAVLARTGLSYATETAAYRASARAKSELRTSVMGKINRLGPVWLTGHNSSALGAVLGKGINGLDAYFARYLPQLILAVLIPVTLAIVILSADVVAFLIVLITIPLIPIFMILIGWYTKTRVERQWDSMAHMSGHFGDVVAGMTTLKAFRRDAIQAQRVKEVGHDYRRATMSVLKISFLSSFALELVAMLSVAMIAVSIGVRLVEGNMALAAGLLVLIIAPEVYWPLRQVGTHFHASAEGLGAARQLMDVLEEPEPASGPRLDVPNLGTVDLEISGACARYRARSRDSLVDFSAVLQAGRVNVLVGPTGAGKSTLLNVLARFMDLSAGTIDVCTVAGKRSALEEFDADAWRHQVVMMTQSAALLPGTVGFNATFDRPQARPEHVWQALETVGLAAFVASLPQQLDTPVGEAGRQMSLGQKRRLAFARVLVSRAPLVLLDEPTASLDADSEAILVAAIEQLAHEGRTVVMVAHRPAARSIAHVTHTVEAPTAVAAQEVTQ